MRRRSTGDRTVRSTTWRRPSWRGENLCKLVTAIAMTVLATDATAVELVCSHNDDLFYAMPGTSCGAYYRCHQNQPVRLRCADGAMFDFNQQKCVRSAGTCYEAVCTGKTNGVYADTSQGCHRSYRCLGGQLISAENCPPGQLFDGGTCAPQTQVVCAGADETSASIQYDADDRCYGLPDGNHVLPGDAGDCKRYLRCQANQVLDVLECPSGYAFDSRKNRCTLHDGSQACQATNLRDELEWDVANAACSFLPDGFHLEASSRDCRAYIECRNRQLLARHECSPLTAFNGQQCVPNFLYNCPRLLDSPGDDICHLRHDGYQVDPRKGCAFYVRCEGQRTVEEHACPYGLDYDSAQSGGECREHHHGSTDSCYRVPYAADCAQRASGYYQALDGACSSYFHCHNGAKTSLACREGYVFDGENCVASDSYQCPADDVDSCRGKPNGYHKDARAGCRAYHLCTEGNKISFLCPPGQVFSGGKCRVRAADGDSLDCAEDSVCAGRADGYYQDRESRCRQYYFCQRGEKLQTLTCRGSKVFDGRSCVPRDSYSCPEVTPFGDEVAASENCITRSCEPSCARAGFHADYDTGCEQYFFCIDGKQSTLACSEDYVFNGEICVPRGSYYCPRYCTPPESC